MAREQFQSLSEQMYYILLALWDEQCGADISGRMNCHRGGSESVPARCTRFWGVFRSRG